MPQADSTHTWGDTGQPLGLSVAGKHLIKPFLA
jgi:hypothetical protein